MPTTHRHILVDCGLALLCGVVSFSALFFFNGVANAVLSLILFLMPGALLGASVLCVLGPRRPVLWVGFSTLCWYASIYAVLSLHPVISDLRAASALVSCLSFLAVLIAARGNFTVRLPVPVTFATVVTAALYGAVIGEFYDTSLRSLRWPRGDNWHLLLTGIVGWQVSLVAVLSVGKTMERSAREAIENGSATPQRP
jgi:hypothetical protein